MRSRTPCLGYLNTGRFGKCDCSRSDGTRGPKVYAGFFLVVGSVEKIQAENLEVRREPERETFGALF